MTVKSNPLQVWQPNPFGPTLGVGNIVTVLFLFPAKLTTIAHKCYNNYKIYNYYIMLFDLFTNPLSFFIWGFSLIVAVTIHEFFHAWTADRLGDPTSRNNGRLSLNPLAHLDPVGTLMLLLTRFGWGKPVPIDSYNLANPRRDAALISLAGPASNLIFAVVLGLIGHVFPLAGLLVSPLIILNVSLALFNLLPVPPLDGSKILFGLLPVEMADQWEETLEHYGLMILLFLLLPFSGRSLAISLLAPVLNFLLDLLL